MNEVICPHCASGRQAMEVAYNGGWCCACGERLPESVTKAASDLARAQCAVPETEKGAVAPVPRLAPFASQPGGPIVKPKASPDMPERLQGKPLMTWWKKALLLTIAWPVALAVVSVILVGVIWAFATSNQLAAVEKIGGMVPLLWFFGTIGIWFLMYHRRKA